jgi:parallel beta helix pectate lyase-like protein
MRKVTAGVSTLLLLFAGCVTTGTGAATTPAGSAFYVSPTGNDRNPGTLAAPFATLARAQHAMKRSSIKATYVEGGTYHLSSAITLTAADSGETWQYYPADGVDTAVLDGGTSTSKGFVLSGASNVTINGLKLQNFVNASIEAYSSPGTVIENNDIGFMTVAPPAGNAAAVIGISVGDHVTVKNNYVHDTAGIGIATFAYNPGSSNDGTVISGNVVLRTAQKSSDNGAIYVSDKATGTSAGHVIISNNFVRDTGGGGFASLRDVYLDDNASNVTVTGNILGPLAAGVATKRGNFNAIFVHNGSNDTISGNIIDLGSSSFVNIVTWGYDRDCLAGMANNVFTNNIILSNFTGPNNADYGYGNYAYLEAPGGQASWFTVTNNVYWNYASGGQAFYNGNFTNDTNPIIENPQISGATYTIAQGSRISSSANFSPIVGGWGPPGFVMPTR